MSANERYATTSEDRISWNQVVAFGFGGLIPVALFNIAGLLMGLIGNIGLGLSAFWLGVILIIPRLWDAISDPLIGHVSDNIRTRWGRRRPFLLIGGILVAISFVVMWWVPKEETLQQWFGADIDYNWFQLGYILFWLLTFFTACTIFEIPHGALGMEMTSDPHERTRLFSAKSFLGNLFAMGTPWLFALANMEFFKGVGGNEVDGMRWVSMLVAVVLIPMSVWWFFACREPGFEIARKQKKIPFWKSMKVAGTNKTFIRLVLIIFTLAMGFNFVALLNYYISIFYLFDGNKEAAGPLLGINGTVWAVTGLVAVFPLNWLGRRLGKQRTLAISVGLMCAAQISKIFCYNRELPYLVVIPTVLLSAGMLMFFTLGSSMLGDICDEDELNTGTRKEGSYYSVYWWFIKMGTAFASFVTGVLIVLTHFDETQTKSIDDLSGQVRVVIQTYEEGSSDDVAESIDKAIVTLDEIEAHFEQKAVELPSESEHYKGLQSHLNENIFQKLHDWNAKRETLDPEAWVAVGDNILSEIRELGLQSPTTLFRLRLLEIGLPVALSIVTLWLIYLYPLTEKRTYEIKHLLEERRARSGKEN